MSSIELRDLVGGGGAYADNSAGHQVDTQTTHPDSPAAPKWQDGWLDDLKIYTDAIMTIGERTPSNDDTARAELYASLDEFSRSLWTTLGYTLNSTAAPEGRLDFATTWPHIKRGFDTLIGAYQDSQTPTADMPAPYFAAHFMRGYHPILRSLTAERLVGLGPLTKTAAHTRVTLARMVSDMPTGFASYMGESHTPAGTYLRALGATVLLGAGHTRWGASLVLPANPHDTVSRQEAGKAPTRLADIYIATDPGQWVPAYVNAHPKGRNRGRQGGSSACRIPFVPYIQDAYRSVFQAGDPDATPVSASQACQLLTDLLVRPGAAMNPAVGTSESYERVPVTQEQSFLFQADIIRRVHDAIAVFLSSLEKNPAPVEQ